MSEKEVRTKGIQKLKYQGRPRQIPVYLARSFRLFVTQSDWKVLPMAAIIGGLIAFVVGRTIFRTQEATVMGAFLLSCVCIWNGCFNSIQNVCRERPILKREHRAGMHISAFVIAQMIYQAIICALQSAIVLVIFYYAGVSFPAVSIMTPWFLMDFWITLFLMTFAADMMAFFISCIVQNTTTAMTLMPFILMFMLMFAGGPIDLAGAAEVIQKFTLSHYGVVALTALGRFNELPMVTLWNDMIQFQDEFIYEGEKPIKLLVEAMRGDGSAYDFEMQTGQMSAQEIYNPTMENIGKCWLIIIGFAILFAFLSMVAMKFIDKDKR